MYLLRKLIISFILLALGLSLSPTFAQTTFEKFGKNRVQYKKFYWRNISTFNFDIYYYDNGSRLANFATRYLEVEFDEITGILGYTPYFKTKIFIYNSVSDLQQSNVGIEDDNIIVGGQTDFFNSQVEIPFTGSEVDFKIELRRGLALMLIREMMFGGSLKDMLQSTYLGNFSEWFLLGGAAYVAEGWSEEMDDRLRDLFKRRRNRKPNLLDGEEAIIIGQSIWNYIAEEYGTNNIASILNLARIIRNERNSIGSTLGIRYNDFLDNWRGFYQSRFQETIANTEDGTQAIRLRKRNRRGFVYHQFKMSPEGDKVAYTENLNGKYRVVVQDLRKRKKKVLMRTGYLAINQRYDREIPALAWRDNNHLGIFYMKKGEVQMKVLNMKKKTRYYKEWVYFNHVSDFDFSDDGMYMLISADRKGRADYETGQNDLYIYNLDEDILEKKTDDWFDDLDPKFLPGSNRAFVFSSNRPSDSLNANIISDRGNYNEDYRNFDLFVYDPNQSITEFNRLTYSGGRDISPRFLDNKTLLYLSDDSGTFQLYRYDLATGKQKALSNYSQSLRSFAASKSQQGLVYLMPRKGRFYPFYQSNFDFDRNETPFETARAKLLKGRNEFAPRIVPPKEPKQVVVDSSLIDQPKEEEIYAEDEIDTDNYTFGEEIVKEQRSGLEKAQSAMLDKVKQAKASQLQVRGPYDYEPRFRTENATTTVQIDPLRGWGLLVEMAASDLLENHKLKGGFFMVTDLRNSDFFGEYQYLARRFDYKLRFDRNTFNFNGTGFVQTHHMNRFELTTSYALSNLMRLSISPFYMNTFHKLTPADGSSFLLDSPNHRYHYTGYRVEFVYDNTRVNGQNMISGTRVKAYFEDTRGLKINQEVADLGVSPSDFSFNRIHLDFRNYFRLHKDLILATRVGYGRFAGNAPKNFILGGMDNWLFNQTDPGQDFTLSQDVIFFANNPNTGEPVFFGNEGLLFTEFITNLRGFNYNKLSGNNFLLANFELRFPIIKYLFGKRINSNFLKNLQIAGFYDIGSAWTGVSPFERENSLNTREVGSDESTFAAVVQDFKNPWLSGYGIGMRSTLLGYYLKLDLAWAIEDFIIADQPKFYLTFGYDF